MYYCAGAPNRGGGGWLGGSQPPPPRILEEGVEYLSTPPNFERI